MRWFLLGASVALRVVLGHSPAAATWIDSIHLESPIHTGIDATVATHDATMAGVAQLVGYRVIDPAAGG